MTSYTVHAPGIESVDNTGLREDVFFVDLSLSVPSLLGKRRREQVLQTTITGRSPREIAPTEASGHSTDEARRATTALREHIAMRERTSGQWKKIPASEHEHIQLLSEPDD